MSTTKGTLMINISDGKKTLFGGMKVKGSAAVKP